jgi:hypothetical protein
MLQRLLVGSQREGKLKKISVMRFGALALFTSALAVSPVGVDWSNFSGQWSDAYAQGASGGAGGPGRLGRVEVGEDGVGADGHFGDGGGVGVEEAAGALVAVKRQHVGDVAAGPQDGVAAAAGVDGDADGAGLAGSKAAISLSMWAGSISGMSPRHTTKASASGAGRRGRS